MKGIGEDLQLLDKKKVLCLKKLFGENYLSSISISVESRPNTFCYVKQSVTAEQYYF